jgi:hypothetical protein
VKSSQVCSRLSPDLPTDTQPISDCDVERIHPDTGRISRPTLVRCLTKRRTRARDPRSNRIRFPFESWSNPNLLLEASRLVVTKQHSRNGSWGRHCSAHSSNALHMNSACYSGPMATVEPLTIEKYVLRLPHTCPRQLRPHRWGCDGISELTCSFPPTEVPCFSVPGS